MIHHFIVGNPKNHQIILLQKFGPLSILFQPIRIIMLRTIQFYHQFCFRTINLPRTFCL